MFRRWWVIGQADVESRQLGELDRLMAAFEAVKGWVDLVIKAMAISVDNRSFLGCGCRLHEQSGAGGQGGFADG